MDTFQATARILTITVFKKTETWWQSVVKGHPQVDATRVDSQRNVSEYDIGTQATIRKLMEEQSRKARGLPSLEEERMEGILDRAKELPGSPFAPQASSASDPIPEASTAATGGGASDSKDYTPRYGTGGTISDPIPPAT